MGKIILKMTYKHVIKNQQKKFSDDRIYRNYIKVT